MNLFEIKWQQVSRNIRHLSRFPCRPNEHSQSFIHLFFIIIGRHAFLYSLNIQIEWQQVSSTLLGFAGVSCNSMPCTVSVPCVTIEQVSVTLVWKTLNGGMIMTIVRPDYQDYWRLEETCCHPTPVKDNQLTLERKTPRR